MKAPPWSETRGHYDTLQGSVEFVCRGWIEKFFPAYGLSTFFYPLVFEKHSRRKMDTKSLLKKIALAKLFHNLVIFGNFCIFWPPKAVPIIITLYRKCKKRKSKQITSQKIQFFVTWFAWKYKIHFCAQVLKLCSPKMFFSKKLKR